MSKYTFYKTKLIVYNIMKQNIETILKSLRYQNFFFFGILKFMILLTIISGYVGKKLLKEWKIEY